jgi:sugar lactone lactonase YvrE
LLLFPSLLFSQVAAAPLVTRLAGSGSSLFNGDQGLAITINLDAPTFVAFDADGNQYLSDTSHNCVRRIDSSGNITTVAGLTTLNGPDTCNSAAGSAPTPAQGLFAPTGLALDDTGRLYISDSLHHCVRSLAPGKSGTAALITVAGTCGSSSTSITVNPQGVALDASGNLYIASQSPSLDATAAPSFQVVRHIASAGPSDACLIAGASSVNLATCPNITGSAKLDHPAGLAFDTTTNTLYIADRGNQCVRKINGIATLETAAGQCANDGTGTSATVLRNPFGLAIASNGALLISQSSPDTIVSLAPDASSLVLIAGLSSGTAGPYVLSQDGSPATTVPLNAPRGIAIDRTGNIAFADSGNNILRRIAAQQTPRIPLTIAVAGASRIYGSANPVFTGTITGALPSERIGDTLVVTYSTAATIRSASGRYAITASVSGPSATKYAVTIQPGTLEITPADTATTLTSSATSAVAGSTITLTATVSSVAGTPAGAVAFYDDGATLLGTSNLNSAGVATLSVTSLAAGSHTIAAIFRDTANFTTSAGTLTQTIATATGSFTLAASQSFPAARSAGQSVYQLTLNSVGIFSGTIALSCSGLPAGGTCAFGSSPTLAPGGSANVVMTITAPTTHASLAAPSTKSSATRLAPITAAVLFPFEFPAFALLFSSPRRKRSARFTIALLVSTVAIAGLTGCGAGGSIASNSAASQTTSYTVQVTGTSLTFNAPPQTIILTVPAQ